MKILVFISTRPELIRLSLIVNRLHKIHGDNLVLIYTNQNYTDNLSTDFIKELGYPSFDYYLMKDKIPKSPGTQLADLIKEMEEVLTIEKCEDMRVLFLGDTNGCLATSIICSRLNIKTYHLEAGNRCYNVNSPEEANRRIIDHSSYMNLCYTENSKTILLREGLAINRIFVIGNPIVDVLDYYIDELSIKKETEPYILVTLHRSENVDNEDVLKDILDALSEISKDIKVIVSTHPRTRQKLNKIGVNEKYYNNVTFSEPFGFVDFINLEKGAKCVITDSGTVGEEATILNKPCVLIREATERVECLEFGNTILSGVKYSDIIRCVNEALKLKLYNYKKVYEGNTINKVCNIVSGNYL